MRIRKVDMRTPFLFCVFLLCFAGLNASAQERGDAEKADNAQSDTSAPAARGRGQRGGGRSGPRRPPLLEDYVKFTVTAPPAELELDPFYKKYVDAQGIPIVSSEKVPDQAHLMARDIVQFMLADRPDLRQELIRKKWKVAIMAESEVTYDIPEHRKFRPLPKVDDERLTPQQKASYYEPGGVGSMTGEAYWNSRGRGFGGEPNGENTTSCAEENLLGYPGTRYFNWPLLLHEFSHGIMRGAIYTVDPEYRKAVEEAYADAKAKNLRSARGYYGNNFNEYWAGGVECYTFHDESGRKHLEEVDPRLYELVKKVIPSGKLPGNIYSGRARLPW
jgi:hypothetical protein